MSRYQLTIFDYVFNNDEYHFSDNLDEIKEIVTDIEHGRSYAIYEITPAGNVIIESGVKVED